MQTSKYGYSFKILPILFSYSPSTSIFIFFFLELQKKKNSKQTIESDVTNGIEGFQEKNFLKKKKR